MNRFRQTWNETCERLGVKPRQFAMLLVVLTVAVTALGIRMVGGGPRRVPQAAAVAAKPSKATTPAANEVRAVAMRQPSTPSAPVVEVSLEGECARDPFRAWDVPVAAAPRTQSEPRATSDGPEPGTLPGLVLRAVVRGELAVFGDQTVRQGQSLLVGDEGHARVVDIGDRTVTVRFDDRLIEVSLGAAEKPAKPAAGGFR